MSKTIVKVLDDLIKKAINVDKTMVVNKSLIISSKKNKTVVKKFNKLSY